MKMNKTLVTSNQEVAERRDLLKLTKSTEAGKGRTEEENPKEIPLKKKVKKRMRTTSLVMKSLKKVSQPECFIDKTFFP